MEKLVVLQSGIDKNNNPWARVEREEQGFKLTGFLHPTEELAVGEEVEVPSIVVQAIEWQA